MTFGLGSRRSIQLSYGGRETAGEDFYHEKPEGTTGKRGGPSEAHASSRQPAGGREARYACHVRISISIAVCAWFASALLAGPADAQQAPGRRRSQASGLPAGSPWRSLAECEAALVRDGKGKGQGKRKAGKSDGKNGQVRIGTWNLKWFPDGKSGKPKPGEGTEVRWMACAIAGLQVQALAVQEVVQHHRGRIAVDDLLNHLDRYTGGRWRARLDDCPDDGRQHVGLLFDSSRLQVSAIRSLPSINPGRNGCDRRLRPGFAAYLRFPGGADLHLLTVHLDSGVSARDHANRRKSWDAIGKAVAAMRKGDRDVVVLGDFNTMGCKKCSPDVLAEEETRGLQAALGGDGTGLRRLETSPGCTHYYKGRGEALDLVLATRDMQELARGAGARACGVCAELACGKPGGEAREALFRLSDHCPVVIELADEDRD